MKKNILLHLTLSLVLLTLAACGGGGGGAGGGGTTPVTPVQAKTAALLTVNMSGALPPSTAIAGVAFTLTLPANVTPALTGGAVAAGVVVPAGAFAGSTLAPQAIYTPAAGGNPGKLDIIVSTSVPAGVTQVGDVATVTLQLSGGAEPVAANFALSSASVIDATLYSAINGMGVNILDLTLQ